MAPGARRSGQIEDDATIEAINAASPDVLWVGLGSPKQEYWAANHSGRVNAGLVLAVGAAFDFHSGRVRRAPLWMRRFGLEWLFRLVMDPRQLARRYLVTNARFIYLIASESARRRLGRGGAGR
jgi:exopolysaccharide biosynthesis WecB/TagA/CpsF family protein